MRVSTVHGIPPPLAVLILVLPAARRYCPNRIPRWKIDLSRGGAAAARGSPAAARYDPAGFPDPARTAEWLPAVVAAASFAGNRRCNTPDPGSRAGK